MVNNATESQEFSQDSITQLKNYRPEKPIRILTATSLFDGHDASINIIRRLLQSRGAELIHLGHNRSAEEIVNAAIQEDVTAMALSSYQGGHMEFFKYIKELLKEKGRGGVKVFGGGGGVITPAEIKELMSMGAVEKIYSPEDGQKLGLDGIIGDLLKRCEGERNDTENEKDTLLDQARLCTLIEEEQNFSTLQKKIAQNCQPRKSLVVGLTGTGGAGKSSLLDELLLRFLHDYKDIKIAVFCVDPSKKKTGGALLGDRIRINSCQDKRIFLRSFASRKSGKELSETSKDLVNCFKDYDYDLIFVETSGIGQGDSAIASLSDLSLYVMTPEYGAQTQLEKIDMLDFADFIVVNKFERAQGEDAYRDIKQTVRRGRFNGIPPKDDIYPVFGTIASRFNDDGTNGLYKALVEKIAENLPGFSKDIDQSRQYSYTSSNRNSLIPSVRSGHLHKVAESVRRYHKKTNELKKQAKVLDSLRTLKSDAGTGVLAMNFEEMQKKETEIIELLGGELNQTLEQWPELQKKYQQEYFEYQVRGKTIKIDSQFKSLSHGVFSRVSAPGFTDYENIVNFVRKENFPGFFPYTGGLFPFRRRTEEAKRQFAGEGGPKQTNARFHFLCKDDKAKRLSTAFDSVTLYGSDPKPRPDIFGKVGESGVSIAHLDDMKELYKNFDLCSPSTSVSMTINGPAPMILAFFLNTAIDQQVEKYEKEHGHKPDEQTYQELRLQTLQNVRGTVQADILKEDQAQNTCIFSIEFALKMMGDVQEYFVQNQIKNYYAVSISGYHIAEAGANPITQLAFTLANGFSYVEYYLSRGLKIDDFAGNLSFFFSNGLDVEYTVIGRVARRIWAIAMRDYYGANSRSQKLKYHIQTSGRSLHAQEMNFNDIRTTLQALIALSDNCNSLHTNAFDEALTTPTEDSVRQAMAIQKIINHEFGAQKSENILQGSYFIEQLTDLVEEAVLKEFDSLANRGGVLAAMEMQYQRSKIQEESMYYEYLKDNGELPIIGVNTFLNPNDKGAEALNSQELTRASYDSKQEQINRCENFQAKNKDRSSQALEDLKQAVIQEKNIFAEMMTAARYCTLGQISQALYEVGGQYRRAM